MMPLCTPAGQSAIVHLNSLLLLLLLLLLLSSNPIRGGATDLNIYIIRPTSGTLGWSTFPWEMAKLGQHFDGVVVHIGTLPGGTMAPYNKGYTMVHEVCGCSSFSCRVYQ
jgi:hypothetical protein